MAEPERGKHFTLLSRKLATFKGLRQRHQLRKRYDVVLYTYILLLTCNATIDQNFLASAVQILTFYPISPPVMIRCERKKHDQEQSLVLPRLSGNRLTHSGLLSAKLLLCM